MPSYGRLGRRVEAREDCDLHRARAFVHAARRLHLVASAPLPRGRAGDHRRRSWFTRPPTDAPRAPAPQGRSRSNQSPGSVSTASRVASGERTADPCDRAACRSRAWLAVEHRVGDVARAAPRAARACRAHCADLRGRAARARSARRSGGRASGTRTSRDTAIEARSTLARIRSGQPGVEVGVLGAVERAVDLGPAGSAHSNASKGS